MKRGNPWFLHGESLVPPCAPSTEEGGSWRKPGFPHAQSHGSPVGPLLHHQGLPTQLGLRRTKPGFADDHIVVPNLNLGRLIQ
jgi:hypothetical protein